MKIRKGIIFCVKMGSYTKNKTFPNGNSYWECRERRSGNGAGRDCLAKITLDPNDQVIKLSEPRTHPADPEKIVFSLCENESILG